MKLLTFKNTMLVLSCMVFSTTFAQNLQNSQELQHQNYNGHINNNKKINNTTISHNDAAIENAVKQHINNSSTLSKLNVDVKTNNGVVILTGKVDSDSQASSLIELAQSIVGVKDVDASNLQIANSEQPYSDMLITAKVKGLLIREDIFGVKDIASINLSVETKNSVVYLTGEIDNQEQINNAIKLIEGVQGVKKVKYNVKKITPLNTNTIQE